MTEQPTTPEDLIGEGVAAFRRQVAEATELRLQAEESRDLAHRRVGELTTENNDLRRQLEEQQQPARLFDLGMAYKGNVDPAPVEKRLGRPVHSSRTYYGGAASEITKAAARVDADEAAGRRTSSVSFKLPVPWADAAAGKADTWAETVADRLTPTGDHRVRVALHHEPEDDKPLTAAHRDQWLAMQLRLAPYFDRPGIEYVVILMGYHSLNSDSSLYPIWKLDEAIPDDPAIKGVGYDLYQVRGAIKDGKTQGWRDFDRLLTQVRAFHATRPGLVWGLSETACTAAAETEKPGVIPRLVDQVISYGGSWLEYFNSNLNSIAGWEMEPGGAREASYAAALARLE